MAFRLPTKKKSWHTGQFRGSISATKPSEYFRFSILQNKLDNSVVAKMVKILTTGLERKVCPVHISSITANQQKLLYQCDWTIIGCKSSRRVDSGQRCSTTGTADRTLHVPETEVERENSSQPCEMGRINGLARAWEWSLYSYWIIRPKNGPRLSRLNP